MRTFFQLAFLILCIVQFFAIWNGLEKLTGMEGIISTVLGVLASVIVAAVPLLGSVFGMSGAVYAWDWSWLQAALLFFSVPVAVSIWALGENRWERFRERTGDRFGRQSPNGKRVGRRSINS